MMLLYSIVQYSIVQYSIVSIYHQSINLSSIRTRKMMMYYCNYMMYNLIVLTVSCIYHQSINQSSIRTRKMMMMYYMMYNKIVWKKKKEKDRGWWQIHREREREDGVFRNIQLISLDRVSMVDSIRSVLFAYYFYLDQSS